VDLLLTTVGNATVIFSNPFLCRVRASSLGVTYFACIDLGRISPTCKISVTNSLQKVPCLILSSCVKSMLGKRKKELAIRTVENGILLSVNPLLKLRHILCCKEVHLTPKQV